MHTSSPGNSDIITKYVIDAALSVISSAWNF